MKRATVRRSLERAAAALMLLVGPTGAAAAQAPPAVAAGTSAAATADFEIESANGRVERIVMQPAGRSERYVFDRFVGDEAAIRDEARRIAAQPARPAFCAGSDDVAQCRRTCGWAEAARPFTRVTLQSADGTARVLSPAHAAPLRFDAGAGSHTSRQGDCVSPDGHYLSVFVAADADASSAQPRVVELANGLPEVRFVGRRTAKIYGEDRYFDFAGWLPGSPHTLRFSYGGGDEPLDDEAVPAR